METTLTEQLVMMLSASATIELNTGSAESKNGYDFKISFLYRRQSCILYMQAKTVEDDVVDFIADYGKADYIGGGYIIYGYDGGVRYVPIAHVHQVFMRTGGEDVNDAERRRWMTQTINEERLWMNLSRILTDRTEVPEYDRWMEFVELGEEEEDEMEDDNDDDNDDDWP
ncbi:hypothetical protein FRC06_002450 [Ceratobasidium sp. 370]|nr:hypothetical protein FRC06_002450 [Ceratobasidium sp. 370]